MIFKIEFFFLNVQYSINMEVNLTSIKITVKLFKTEIRKLNDSWKQFSSLV